MYVDHVINKYKHPVIVFDSYPEPQSIKDVTHLRRTKGIVSPNINFTPTMPCKTKKELFMSNSHNKQAFINMPCEKLNEHDIRYKNAVYDAGLLVVHTAVDCALSPEVIVIGEDTDLLVLLIHHVNQHCKRVIFKSEKWQ
jgi:5'-3' exonuclease